MIRRYIQWILITILLLSTGGCSGEQLYTMFAVISRMQSSLVEKKLSIGKNLQIAYLDNRISNKPTIVFLHGFGVQKEVWLPLAEKLHTDYRLIMPDFIGDGKSSKPRHIDYSIQAQATRLHLFLHKLRIDNAILVGNSMGGAVAVEYAARYPVSALVLLDPLGLEMEKSSLEKMGKKQFEKVFLKICTAKDVQVFMRTVFAHPPCVPDILLDYYAHEKCRFSELDAIKARYLYHKGHWSFNAGFRKRAARITAPTLILWGKRITS